MTELFADRVRIMRICATVELVSMILLFLFAGLFIDAIMAHAALPICLGLFFLIVVSAIGIIFCVQYPKREKVSGVYAVPIETVDLQEVINAFGAVPVAEGAHVCFQRSGRISIRLLLQHCNVFDKKCISNQRKFANKVINATYAVPQWQAMYAALSGVRINLVVCRQGNEDLYAWVGSRTELLLNRTEAIVNAAVILDEKKFLFPAYMGHLTVVQLNRYEAAGMMLAEHLGVSVLNQ